MKKLDYKNYTQVEKEIIQNDLANLQSYIIKNKSKCLYKIDTQKCQKCEYKNLCNDIDNIIQDISKN